MMSGTRKPKLPLLIVKALSLITEPLSPKKPGAVASKVKALRVGVTVDAHVGVGVDAPISEDVEERARPAHREAGELQEGAIPIRRRRRAGAGEAGRVVLGTEADIGTQCAVFGLLAYVP